MYTPAALNVRALHLLNTVLTLANTHKESTKMTDCKCEEHKAKIEAANKKADKATEAKKSLSKKFDEAKETIRLLTAQIEKASGKAQQVAADSKRIGTTLSTIKNIKRMNKGDTIPAESLDYLVEDLTEEFTLSLEHKA